MQTSSVRFASQWQRIWVAKFKNRTTFFFFFSEVTEASDLYYLSAKSFLLRFVFINRLNLIFNFTRWVRCIFENYTCSGNFLLFYSFTITFPVTSVCLKCFGLHSTIHFSVRLAIWLSQTPNTGTDYNSTSLILKQIDLTLTSSALILTHLICRIMHPMQLGSCPDLPLKIFY